MSIAAIIAAVVAPLLVSWAASLANRPSANGASFRPSPPIRAVYPGVLIAGIWGVIFYLNEFREAGFTLAWNDWLGLVGMVALSLTAVLSWPSTILTDKEGLYLHTLFGRKLIAWDQIDSADSGMDGELTIYAKNGLRFEVSKFVEGRPQLKELIRERAGKGVMIRRQPPE